MAAVTTVTGRSVQAGTGETIFSTRTIYQDANNTYDPGGRLGQLMFRINW
jgi:hypothetical protein